jgi:hypothetical protein
MTIIKRPILGTRKGRRGGVVLEIASCISNWKFEVLFRNEMIESK